MDKQYKRILVPLDGSALAEVALADAVTIAHLSGAELVLLHVMPPLEDFFAPDVVHPMFVDQKWESQKRLALDYLNSVCKRLGNDTTVIRKVVEIGPAAETIIDYAHENAIDLIVMSSHGRSGLARWAYGSVADRVVRYSPCPVLLVRQEVTKADE